MNPVCPVRLLRDQIHYSQKFLQLLFLASKCKLHAFLIYRIMLQAIQ